MRVLVTFAVEAEFAAWRKLRRFNLFDYDGLKLWKARVGDADATVLITGVGTRAASQAMDLMMRLADKEQSYDICVSSGLAGALCETLSVGDVVAPRELIAELSHSHVAVDRLDVDAELRKAALQQGAKSADCLFTTDQVLIKAEQKKSCASRAQSVDMESFEIIKQAQAWGARSVVIRAISDSATEDLPINFNLTLAANHQVSITKVLLQVAKNPGVLPSLLRFGRQSQRAGETLANFLENYLHGIAATSVATRTNQVAAG